MNINIDGDIGNKGHVFIFDGEDKLRMKFWFHGDGVVLWRRFDKDGCTDDSGRILVILDEDELKNE